MASVVDARGVTRRFSGRWALRGIDLTLEPGQVMGLLGPNGSGKSTLIKILAGVQRPTAGDVLVLGRRPGRETKGRVAYLPDVDHLYRGMTGHEAIGFMAAFFPDFDEGRARSLLEPMGVPPEQPFGQLSRGLRARLKLVLTLARRAGLLLLDEPLSGIDVVSRGRILQAILAEYRLDEQAIILATHEIGEAEALFDRVVFLREGEVVLAGRAEDLRAERRKSIEDIYREEYA